MANLTAAANPELVLEMEAMERTTPAHCDEWNRRHQQLLDNDKFLHEQMKNVFVNNAGAHNILVTTLTRALLRAWEERRRSG